MTAGEPDILAEEPAADGLSPDELRASHTRLRRQVESLRSRVRKGEDRRRALLHIMADLHRTNNRLDNQRKAMLHILQDVHRSNQRLERSRKAMIHIMGDLADTTAQIQRREQELRDKQEQLVQAGKLATLGELTTGVAHELNNPLNNIGLFVGNAIDLLDLGEEDRGRVLGELHKAMQQVRKATQIISHLRTFGRAASVTREPVAVQEVIRRALSLIEEQLRLRQITVELSPCPDDPVVIGNPIQLEQVFINLLTNARDALADSPTKVIAIGCATAADEVELTFRDTGPGIPAGLEKRVFDPFFTTKEVGQGTGLGLSITYGIIKDHGGSIAVVSAPGAGATFRIRLPLARERAEEAFAP